MTQTPKPATELPWYAEITENDVWVGNAKAYSTKVSDVIYHSETSPYTHSVVEKRRQDASYIVHACNNYPALEAENARLREALKEALPRMRTCSNELYNITKHIEGASQFKSENEAIISRSQAALQQGGE